MNPFGKSPSASQARIWTAWLHKQHGIALWPERVGQGDEDRQPFDCATWLHKAREMPKEKVKDGSREGTDRARNRSVGDSFWRFILAS